MKLQREDIHPLQDTCPYLGYSDWRLPNIKELQSIVDYTRSPGITGSAAIDALFNATPITNEEGILDWGATTGAPPPTPTGKATEARQPISPSGADLAATQTFLSGSTYTAPVANGAIRKSATPPTTPPDSARRAMPFESTTSCAPCAIPQNPLTRILTATDCRTGGKRNIMATQPTPTPLQSAPTESIQSRRPTLPGSIRPMPKAGS